MLPASPAEIGAPACALYRHFQARRIDRLQEVVDGVHLERLDRMLIVRRHEDDMRIGATIDEPACHFESGQAGHLHVQKHDVGVKTIDGRQRFEAVAGFADHLHAADAAEQIPQLIACQLLVVHQYGAKIHRQLWPRKHENTKTKRRKPQTHSS